MQSAASDVNTWSNRNNMLVNPIKTKEMIVLFSNLTPIPPTIYINDVEIERVTSSKLLGVIVSSDLKWQKHIEYLYSRASSKLYGLVMLRKAGLSCEDLVDAYIKRIRSVVEYSCQVWHSGLTKEQSDTLESIQRRALKIIYPNLSYQEALGAANLTTLYLRREHMCHKLFIQMQQPDHRLHKLLPPQKPNRYGLRKCNKYETIKCKTNRYHNSLIPYCLRHFQS